MIVKDKEDIVLTPVQDDTVRDVEMNVLIGEVEGIPNFFMRKFVIEEGGYTPYHTHDWEHVVYILEGSGTLKGNDQELELKAGSSVLGSPNEEHQFRADRNTGLSFLCSIPKI
jgi:quercetin dioxygenase-like cupin family protein